MREVAKWIKNGCLQKNMPKLVKSVSSTGNADNRIVEFHEPIINVSKLRETMRKRMPGSKIGGTMDTITIGNEIIIRGKKPNYHTISEKYFNVMNNKTGKTILELLAEHLEKRGAE